MKRLLIAVVRGYQLLFSAWVGGQCRFTPTCSQFTIGALRQHGAARGSYLGAMRIVRCSPWCAGGHDPVPETFHWAAWRRPMPQEAADEPAPEKDEMAHGDPVPKPASKPVQDAVTPPQV